MKLPWGIYVHVPWCRRRCPYCDFYFVVSKSRVGFARRIIEEFKERQEGWPQRPALTLALGGGTPSWLGAEEITELTAFFLDEGLLVADAEVGMEVNPEDVTPQNVVAWKSAGINRISVGVQSFDDEILTQLGRKHRGEQAFSAIAELTAAGISVGVDLIMGVPGEKPNRTQADAEKALDLGVKHLSLYLLTVEPNTPWVKLIEKGKRQAPDADVQADLFEVMAHHLNDRGLIHYEISNHAFEGFQSRHNRLYWSQGLYLGLGPGAHAMRILPDGSTERSANAGDLEAWWATPQAPPRQTEILPPNQAFLEAVAFGLRDLEKGIRVSELAQRHKTQVPPELAGLLGRLSHTGQVQGAEGHFRLSAAGALFADGVARQILSIAPLAGGKGRA
jgi:oxygen-independent coproporphyrinogen-3 oxidase